MPRELLPKVGILIKQPYLFCRRVSIAHKKIPPCFPL
jgi:hypothetical protein